MYTDISQMFVLGDCQWANVQTQPTCGVVNECPPLPVRDTGMHLHSREASTSLPPVDDNVPLNGDSPHREDPVVMHDTASDDVSPSRVVSSPTRIETSHVRRGTEPENHQRTWLTINLDRHVSRRVN